MILDIDDSKEIKEILDEIPKCHVDEFPRGSVDETETSNSTEPNDSPFRVRRLSRSFSIPNGIKLEDKMVAAEEAKDELLLANDENRQEQEQGNFKGTNGHGAKFIILKRSRSLGNIFLPNSVPSTAEDDASKDESVKNSTEKVEALEIEVLSCKNEESSEICSTDPVASFVIDRPQTSPPVLAATPTARSSSTDKPTILDRMQKSLGFIFRCARREDEEEELKYPLRSQTPDPKYTRKPVAVIKKQQKEPAIKPPAKESAADVPSQNINLNNFVTKVDSESAAKGAESVKKLPQFFDISGPKGPLLQPQSEFHAGKKCLVLDLDETLVHSTFHVPESHDLVVTLGLPDGSQQNIYVAKRPGVDEFLARVSEKFEVVIFTASLAHYADPVIDFLTVGMNKHLGEPREINLRLYRESCLFLRGLYVKDLSRLGRKLEHTVIVDNSPASFLLQPDHGIPIKSWFSDMGDTELALLHDSLIHLVEAESVSEWRSKLSV